MTTTQPRIAWRRWVANACVIGTAAASGLAWGQPVPRALTVRALPGTSADAATRSVVFDNNKADDLRLRQQPSYVERIFVEAQDPDAARAKRKPLEQTFAESLLAPRAASAMGLRRITTTPCYATQSSLNTIGDSMAPLTGCPGFKNTP